MSEKMKIRIKFFGVMLLVLLPFGELASATVGFKPAQSYAVGTAPETVTSADFNNDGKPDIAVVCYGDPSVGDDGGVSILLANGDGTFQPATKLTAGKNPTRIATADFVAPWCSRSSAEIRGLLNRRETAGTFAESGHEWNSAPSLN